MSNTKGQFKVELANNPGKPDGSNSETRVRKVAEEMAKDTHPGTWQAAKESLIEHFTPAARIAVRHLTRTARDAWEESRLSWFREIGELVEGEEAFLNLDEYLRDRGLIPSLEKK